VPVAVLVLLVCLSSTSIAETIEGLVIAVADGDTFTLLTPDQRQIKVRVAEIDAPERGQPYARRSRQQLADLILQKDVTVYVQVVDRYDRVVGRPVAGTLDVSAEMIRSGAAWVYRTYSDDVRLYELERTAKTESRGLWSLPEFDRVMPWAWRNGPSSGNSATTAQAFECGSKTYCREMVSCDEAKFHLESCGLTRLDGDGDGIPCEAMCQ
jgi:endonuclease YncB( thermonuclease family)